MRKTQKRVLGVLGLCLVTAMTIFAAILPGPKASATTTSVTDTINVRVVGSVPSLNITGLESGDVFVNPKHTLGFSYENVDNVTVTLKYTDADGIEHTYTLATYNPDYYPGEDTYELDLSDYGFGEYVIEISGTAFDGTPDFDIKKFSYYPVYGTAEENEVGDYDVHLTYDPYDETTGEGTVANIVANVYGPDGNLVESMSPINIVAPTTDFTLSFADAGLPAGTYTISIVAYDKDGNPLYIPYIITIDYEVPPIPDTGGLFQNLNISRTDYLITGLIIFGIVGVGGAIFISKRSKSTNRRRR